MSNVTGVPYAGPFDISLHEVKEHLIDLPKNALQRLRSEQDGINSVITELAQNFPTHGENAGIPTRVYQSFVDDTVAIEKLTNHEDILEKALEVVRETKARKVHNRENTISQMVDAVKSTAQRTGNDAILAPFEGTMRYNSQIAEKAALTRRRNAESKTTGQENPPDDDTP